SCISPTPYHKQSSSSQDGFVIKKITDVKYQISFYGNDETGLDRANDYVILRSAHEAANRGYPFFTILKKKSTTTTQNYSYKKDHATPIKVVNKDGSVTMTTQYTAQYGNSVKKYAMTRPRVYTIIEFLEDDYDQDKEILNSSEIIKKFSDKYNLKISISSEIK
ncbi:MAG: hypothetical protein ACC653_06495, partial [Gammaproteobacteria bacterium]